jgi:hypothetical protein
MNTYLCVSSRTTRANGSLRIKSSVDFWYLRISFKALVPGLYRRTRLIAEDLDVRLRDENALLAPAPVDLRRGVLMSCRSRKLLLGDFLDARPPIMPLALIRTMFLVFCLFVCLFSFKLDGSILQFDVF